MLNNQYNLSVLLASYYEFNETERHRATKIVLTGPASGKTYFTYRFMYNSYPLGFTSKTDVEFASKTTSLAPPVSNGHTLKLQIWDVSSMLSKNNLQNPTLATCYKDAFAIFVTIDFQSDTWKSDCDRHLDLIKRHQSNAVIYLIVTKQDAPQPAEFLALQNKYGASYKIFATSAKTGMGIKAPFEEATQVYLLPLHKNLLNLRQFCGSDEEFHYLMSLKNPEFLFERAEWARNYYGTGTLFLPPRSSSFALLNLWNSVMPSNEKDNIQRIKKNIFIHALQVNEQSALNHSSIEGTSWQREPATFQSVLAQMRAVHKNL